jgi:TetR/AcrR family transcriptional regulator, transcriptional repressor for nem operon
MKKSKIEAAETRRRIIKTAAAEFRRKGINGAGVNDVMAAAGLTHGGFYRHFASKRQLVAEACAAAMGSVEETNEGSACPALGKDGLEAMLADYLSTDHRDNPSEGCVLAGLGAELARSDVKTRGAATAGFLTLVDAFAQQYRRMKPQAAKARALVAVSAIIGAITMSRIVTDPKLSAAILRQTKKHLAAM